LIAGLGVADGYHRRPAPWQNKRLRSRDTLWRFPVRWNCFINFIYFVRARHPCAVSHSLDISSCSGTHQSEVRILSRRRKGFHRSRQPPLHCVAPWQAQRLQLRRFSAVETWCDSRSIRRCSAWDGWITRCSGGDLWRLVMNYCHWPHTRNTMEIPWNATLLAANQQISSAKNARSCGGENPWLPFGARRS